jgi:CBS domain-containing protein
MSVTEIMASDPITVSEDATLSSAMQLMDEHAIRHLPVVRNTLLIGVLSDRDMLDREGWLVARVGDEVELDSSRVRDAMHVQPLTIEPETMLARAVEIMDEWNVGCLPVVREGALVGLLTATDLLETFVGSCRYGRMAQDDPAVEAVMTPSPATIAPETSFAEIQKLLKKADYRHLPVVRNGRPIGIVSDRDLRRAAGRSLPYNAQVASWMTASVETLAAGELLSNAARRMTREAIGALPVVDDAGQLVGILTIVDVLARFRHTLDDRTDTASSDQ